MAVCTVCGRTWRPDERGWRAWLAESGHRWGGEAFATCGRECADAFISDCRPGFASRASQEHWRACEQRHDPFTHYPPPPPRDKRKRSRAS